MIKIEKSNEYFKAIDKFLRRYRVQYYLGVNNSGERLCATYEEALEAYNQIIL